LLKRLNTLPVLFFVALVLLFSCIWLPFQGEEGNYIASTLEMIYHHQYAYATVYESYYGRTPLINWLIIPVIKLIGNWHATLIAARIVVAAATACTAWLVYGFSRGYGLSKNTALFAAASFLSGDLLISHGWIAYADPLLLLFNTLAIFSVILALEKRTCWYFPLAAIGIILAFLTKGFTPYSFFAMTCLVLLCAHKNRRYLFHPLAIISYIIALGFPLFWGHFFDPRSLGRMWFDMMNTDSMTLIDYITNVIKSPLSFILCTAPASLVAIYYLIRQKKSPAPVGRPKARLLFWMVFWNFVAYWFSVKYFEARYIMPLYPLVAVWAVMALAYCDVPWQRVLMRWLWGVLALKLVYSQILYPYFYKRNGVPYRAIAERVVKVANNRPIGIYKQPNSGYTESIIAWIDMLTFPKKPIATSAHLSPGVWICGTKINKGQLLFQYKEYSDTVYFYILR
jgi:4-amino-4-deoxy-L-arabinose transferase-like glycosyltransferase